MATIGKKHTVVTLTPADRNVTLAGPISAYGSIGVYDINTGAGLAPETIASAVFGPSTTRFTIHNAGTVTSLGTSPFGSGIALGAAGTVFNTGAIDAGTDIAIFGTKGVSAVQNSGDLYASAGVAIFAQMAADISNDAEIYGKQNGIVLQAGGTLINQPAAASAPASAIITGGKDFAVLADAPATILNAGFIYGYAGGLQLDGGGGVNNTGRIVQLVPQLPQLASLASGAAIGLATTGTVTNAGTLDGSNGIKFRGPTSFGRAAPGTAIITNTGYISAASNLSITTLGLYSGFANYGVGIFSNIAGTVTNQGTIQGDHAGIIFGYAYARITNSGLISSSDGEGIQLYGGGSVFNTGTISGYKWGIISGGLTASDIDNTGLITASELPPADFENDPVDPSEYISVAILQFAPGTVNNAGTVTDPNGDGIFLRNFFVNFNTGSLGYGHGSLINSGVVAAEYGLIFGGFGGVTNTGTILSQNAAVEIALGSNQLYNSGLINAFGTTFVNALGTNTATGIMLNAGGTVTNAATGTIAAPIGIDSTHDATTITNAGLITATTDAVLLNAAGTVANAGTIQAGTFGIYLQTTGDIRNTGQITAGLEGLYIKGPGGYGYNSGQITAQIGMALGQNGELDNQGTIGVSLNGLFLYEAGTFINAGTIDATGTYIGAAGIVLQQGGQGVNAGQITGAFGLISNAFAAITNTATGTITGTGTAGLYAAVLLNIGGGYLRNSGVITAPAATAVYAVGPATILNTGTITGATGIDLQAGGTIFESGTVSAANAISFAAGYTSRLVIDAAAAITGHVIGGGGVLELAADRAIGSLSTKTQFLDFNSIQIDPGAVWDFTGRDTITAALLNNGTIRESAHDTLVLDDALAGTGTVKLSKNPLALNNSVAAGQKIAFTGTAETLALGDPKAFQAKIENFAAGDSIDLTGIALSAITATHFVHSVLTLDEGATKLAFTFANPGTFGTETFALTAAGQGTAITLAPGAVLTAMPDAQAKQAVAFLKKSSAKNF